MEQKMDPSYGLTHEQVAQRRKQFGSNALPSPRVPTFLQLFIGQLRNPINYLVLLAALFKLLFEGWHDAALMSSLLCISACIGAWYERRAQLVVLGLHALIAPECMVLRHGEAHLTPHEDVVVGDILLLQEGNRIPADARVVTSRSLSIDESVLTGESQTIIKNVGDSLYRGTLVTRGSGVAEVVAVGVQTELGKIQTSMESFAQQSPFHREVSRLSNYLLSGSIVIVCLFFILGFIRGFTFLDLLCASTSLLVCIVPEGIPIVSAIVLAISGYRMAQKLVVVKHGAAIDAFGRINVLCIDKTGTLTRNEQMVVAVYTDGEEYTVSGSGYALEGWVKDTSGTLIDASNVKSKQTLDRIAMLCALFDDSERMFDEQRNMERIKGEPIHAALGVFAHKLGWTRTRCTTECVRLEEVPFSTATRMQQIKFEEEKITYTGIIGSPEQACLPMSHSAAMQSAFERFLARGYRVISCALQRDGEQPECIGMIGMEDAIRPESAQLVTQLKEMGIAVVMLTGDHPETAGHVAQAVGLARTKDLALDPTRSALLDLGCRGTPLPGVRVEPLSGAELHTLTDAQILSRLSQNPVIARVTPRDKAYLIGVFHRAGNYVGMTGDGVNDAPALVAADVGIALGKNGTDVAQEAADVVLLDDSLHSIVQGVERGRQITCLMRQVFLYLLTTNGGEVLAVFIALLIGLPLPLLAVQILWINFITDGFLDIALGMEPPEETGVNTKTCRFIDRGFISRVLITGIPMAVGTLLLFYWHLEEGVAKARTVALVTLALFQWFNAWNVRSDKKSLFAMSPFSNLWLVWVTLLVVGLQLCALYLPGMNSLLKTVPLGLMDLVESFAVASTIVLVEEVRKWWSRAPSF